MNPLLLLFFATLHITPTRNQNLPVTDSILKVAMHLSNYGVESDDYPSVNAYIDFRNDSSHCYKYYNDPAHPSATYSLTPQEMKTVYQFLQNISLNTLKPDYLAPATDLPTSTDTIYTTNGKVVVWDYGLLGQFHDIYKIIYRQ